MNAEKLFGLTGLLVMPFWVLMIFAPRARLTAWAMRRPVGPALPALMYLALIAPKLAAVLPLLMRPKLGEISALLGSPEGATIAWLHFLAFDLFVGRWIFLDARERGLSAWLVSPLLFLTLMVGPVGLLAYLGARWAVAFLRTEQARALLRKLWATAPEMMVSTAAHLAALVAFVVLAVVDQRVVNGQLAWIKPAKFAISGALYMTALAWAMSFIDGHRRAVRVVSRVTAFVLAFEVALIAMQAGRGAVSHFNISTPFDQAVFGIMGAAVLVAWVVGWAVPVLLVRQKFADPALASALRTGVIVSMIGASLGGLMISPTRSQVEVMKRGERSARAGAHTVGAPDGGEGLPVLGWSMEGGDLRIAHFAGLHALQVLPLLGLWIRRRGSRRGLGGLAQRRLVRVATGGYLGLIGVLAIQALRAEPLIAPSGVTVALFGAVAAATAIGWVLAGRRDSAAPERSDTAPQSLASAA